MAAADDAGPRGLPDDGPRLLTGEAVELDVRPTGFVLRGAGAVIDFAATVVVGVGLAFGAATLIGAAALDEATASALTIAVLVLVLVVLPTLVETLTRGRSLGRLATGARIVRDDGGSIGFRHAFIRALIGVLELYFTLGSIAALVGLLHPRAKRLGDLLAGTVSQQERVAAVPPPAFGMPAELEDWRPTADVAALPDGLSRRIAAFLRSAPSMLPASRARLADELAAEAAPFHSPPPRPVPAEVLLAGIAVLRRERAAESLRREEERRDRLAMALSGNPHRFPDR